MIGFPEEFLGYARSSGRSGCRNHVLVISAMDSANSTVRRIASMVPKVYPLTIAYGRGQYGRDGAQTQLVLTHLATHPNVAACVIVSLEPVSAGILADAVGRTGIPVETVTIQQSGDGVRAACYGATRASRLVKFASQQRRVLVPVSDLVLGTECGGSDTTSGLASNPATGWAADRLVDAGGQACFSETSEILGAEHVLARRAANEDVARDIYSIVAQVEIEANRRGVDIRGANPVPDNIRGGITTIEEKSLGAILKGGTRDVQGVIEYGRRIPSAAGLYVMDTPAPAAESLTGLVSGGCQLIAFTTGVGNTLGSKLAPTVKVTANPHTAASMAISIDVDVSNVMLGKESLADAGGRICTSIVGFLEGTYTSSEILGEEEISISRIESTI